MDHSRSRVAHSGDRFSKGAEWNTFMPPKIAASKVFIYFRANFTNNFSLNLNLTFDTQSYVL